MGNQLQALVQDWREKMLSDGKTVSGNGRLTNNGINLFQTLYGFAIRSNLEDPKAMAKAASTSLKHYCSTPQRSQLNDCPTVAASWCSFQRDRAMGTMNHKSIKYPISSCIQTLMTPIFHKLGNENFLDGCRNLRSSNSNKSFHHVL